MTIPEICRSVGAIQPVKAEWLTIPETAAYIGTDKTAINALIDKGRIKCIELKVKKSNRRGSKLVYLPSLQRYIDRLKR